MNKPSQIVSAAMTLALGVLFLILKNDIIGIAITVLGVALIVAAIIDLVRKSITTGVIKALLGVAVLVIGWLLLEVALLILGIVLLVYGIVELAKIVTVIVKGKNNKLLAIILGIIEPILCIVASIFLMTSTGTAIEWTIIVAGIILIVDGVLALVSALLSKN